MGSQSCGSGLLLLGFALCIVAGQTVLLEVTLYCHTLQLRICADGWNNKGNSQLHGANGIKKLQRVNNMVTY